jgi:hypothetical protein
MPLGYELFAGNRADVTTVKEIVETMERRYGLASRIWVMDRGMASAANLQWLKASGRRYLIGTTRAGLRQFISELTSPTGWQSVGEAVEVKLVAGAAGEDSYLLCRSTQRRAKEQGMHQRFAQRIDQGLERLAARIARSKGPLERSALDRQIGRLLGANGHAAGRYIVELVDDPSCAAGLKLTVSINQQWEQRAALAEGCYVLRTNLTQWTHRRCGALISNSLRLRPLSGFTNASFPFVRSGIKSKAVWRLTSWFVSWPM